MEGKVKPLPNKTSGYGLDVESSTEVSGRARSMNNDSADFTCISRQIVPNSWARRQPGKPGLRQLTAWWTALLAKQSHR